MAPLAPYESLLGSPNILQEALDAMHKQNSGLVVLATPARYMWRHSTWAFVWHAVNFLPEIGYWSQHISVGSFWARLKISPEEPCVAFSAVADLCCHHRPLQSSL